MLGTRSPAVVTEVSEICTFAVSASRCPENELRRNPAWEAGFGGSRGGRTILLRLFRQKPRDIIGPLRSRQDARPQGDFTCAHYAESAVFCSSLLRAFRLRPPQAKRRPASFS